MDITIVIVIRRVDQLHSVGFTNGWNMACVYHYRNWLHRDGQISESYTFIEILKVVRLVFSDKTTL
jgi:hypothetical protein